MCRDGDQRKSPFPMHASYTSPSLSPEAQGTSAARATRGQVAARGDTSNDSQDEDLTPHFPSLPLTHLFYHSFAYSLTRSSTD